MHESEFTLGGNMLWGKFALGEAKVALGKRRKLAKKERI